MTLCEDYNAIFIEPIFEFVYIQSMANFAQQATDMNIDILSLGSISFDLDVVFGNWRALDVKIIVGMFGPAEARAVICQVCFLCVQL